MTGFPPTALPHVSGPANAALDRVGITTLDELADHTEREIAALHGMGPKGIRILKAALAEAGLAFARPPGKTESPTP